VAKAKVAKVGKSQSQNDIVGDCKNFRKTVFDQSSSSTQISRANVRRPPTFPWLEKETYVRLDDDTTHSYIQKLFIKINKLNRKKNCW
jgi:hypothetical protein